MKKNFRIPILLNFDPISLMGPKVLISEGKWKVVPEGVIDSKLSIVTPNDEYMIEEDLIIKLDRLTPLSVIVKESGNAINISMYLELQEE